MDYKVHRWLIIMKVRKFKLPLSVRSTAVRVFNLIADDLEKYRLQNDDLVMISIMVACKCEDVQGGIDSMLHRLGFDRRMELVGYESMILKQLNYNFYFSSPYTKVYAILVILQERELLKINNTPNEDSIANDLDQIWDRAVENIDYILCLDNRNCNEIEIAYAALEFPKEIFKSLSFKYSEANLDNLNTNINILKEELSKYC
ncbi:hypothetical protein NGRA_1976 [Nosema granulosis]|uniref:Uncharacterized protein n=1 Tax=Nosema granulosis TaxID=83296 RepID=A0A9P6KYK8_9MICR|nr:hypothetical protein NGRA_1976 [Nosema granulosis]